AGLFCRSGSPPVWSLLLLPLCFVWFAIFGVCSISGKSLNRYPLNHYIISVTGTRSYMMLLGLLQRLLE
ncbi:hypothetical protein ISN44_As11g002360, partial [Arabidopsis suecica]